LLLAQLLQRQGLTARVAGHGTLSVAGIARLNPDRVGIICLSYLDVSSPAHLRFAVRRLRRRVPEATVVIGSWGQDPAAATEMAKSAKAKLYPDPDATSFLTVGQEFFRRDVSRLRPFDRRGHRTSCVGERR
jgi:hypothetical protein